MRAEARAWLEANAVPKGHPDDFSAGIWTTDYAEDVYVKRCREWQGVLAEGGWAGITWPRAYGGRGAPPIHQVIFNQEQARYGVSSGAFAIALGMVGPTILAHGTEEQKVRYLPAMLRGDELWCQLFSETEAGSDLANLSTRAVRDGDTWVVDGQKVWTSSAERAEWGILLARTDLDAPKHQGITYFLLDMSTPGIEIRPLRQMTGDAHFSEVFLDGVRIPAANVLGAVGEGWKVAQTTLTSERSSIAGGSGGADPPGLIELARTFGQAGDPLTRQALVEAHVRGELLRFLRYRSQTALSQGRRPGPETSVMKLAYARFMQQMTSTAIHVQGATAMLDDPASCCRAEVSGSPSSSTRRHCGSPAAPTRCRPTSSASGSWACRGSRRHDLARSAKTLTKSQEARRQRVLSAALELGAEGGYDAVQIRDVAQRADVALGTIYRYFSSKDALLSAAMVLWVEDLEARLAQRAPRGDTTAERVYDVLRRAVAGHGARTEAGRGGHHGHEGQQRPLGPSHHRGLGGARPHHAARLPRGRRRRDRGGHDQGPGPRVVLVPGLLDDRRGRHGLGGRRAGDRLPPPARPARLGRHPI